MTARKHVLVTGGAGFIGFHLARKLSDDPRARVTLVDNLSRGREDAALAELCRRSNVELLVRDMVAIGNTAALADIVGEVDEVYHLAAVNGTRTFYEHPASVLHTNLKTLMDLLECALLAPRAAPRILFASSNEAYAGLEGMGSLPIPTPEGVPLVVEAPRNPRWSYGGSKLAGELLMHAYAAEHGMPGVIVRPHNFYGPRSQPGHVIPDMIGRLLRRESPFVIRGGAQTRSFCYIDDAVDALIRTMEHASAACPTFHIGTPDEISMNKLAHMLFDVAGWHPERVTHEPAPAGSVNRRVPDVGKIRDATGWQASTSLAVGLRRTFAWFQNTTAAS